VIRLTMDRTTAAGVLATLPLMSCDHPGEHRLEVHVGERTMKLGDPWLFSDSDECIAALSEFGTVEVVQEDQP
jgi:hypothetical protein